MAVPRKRYTRRGSGPAGDAAAAANAERERIRKESFEAIANRRPSHDGRPQKNDLRHGRGAVSLGTILNSLVRERELGKRDRTDDAFEALREVVGPSLASRLHPQRLRGRELSVRVDSASLYQELVAFTGRGIEKRFAATCVRRGLPGVDKLTFRQTT